MLLEVDGLHAKWSRGYRSDWKDMDDIDTPDEMPNTIRRLLQPVSRTISDLSGDGRGHDFVPTNNSIEDSSMEVTPVADSEGYISVKDLPLDAFWKRLVLHFNIAFKEKLIVWPLRNNS